MFYRRFDVRFNNIKTWECDSIGANRSFEWLYFWVYLNGKFARDFVSKEVSKAGSDTNFKLMNDGFSFILSFVHVQSIYKGYT